MDEVPIVHVAGVAFDVQSFLDVVIQNVRVKDSRDLRQFASKPQPSCAEAGHEIAHQTI